MGEYAYRELLNWIEGLPLENEVDMTCLSERA
jgi:hypothetical protein